VRWHRFVRSGLGERPYDSPVVAASELFGVQAQINSAACVALAHRTEWDEAGPGDLQARVEAGEGLVRCWGQRGTLHLYDARDWPPDHWPVRLLGRFDPLVLAHSDKSWWIDPEHQRRVWHHTHVEATLLLGGRIVGVWRYQRMARGLKISVELFAGVRAGRAIRKEITEQAERVSRALDAPLLDHVVTTS